MTDTVAAIMKSIAPLLGADVFGPTGIWIDPPFELRDGSGGNRVLDIVLAKSRPRPHLTAARSPVERSAPTL